MIFQKWFKFSIKTNFSEILTTTKLIKHIKLIIPDEIPDHITSNTQEGDQKQQDNGGLQFIENSSDEDDEEDNSDEVNNEI